MANLTTLRKQLEAGERANKRTELAQQTAPVLFTTGERNTGPATELRARIQGTMNQIPLSSIRNRQIPYTVDKEDYDQFEGLVQVYTDALRGKTEEVKPSTLRNLAATMANQGGNLRQMGTGLMMFAGGKGLDQAPIIDARNAKQAAEIEAARTISNVGRYKSDFDYMLSEKTNNYEDFKARMEEARENPEDLKKAVSWGERYTTKGIAQLAQDAAAAATDQELQEMLKNARTPGETEAFQAEIERRKKPEGRDRTEIGQYGQGNIDLYSRQPYVNEDGSISTVDSFSVNIDGKEVLLPTIVDGKRVSEDEAIARYMETGENLGEFATPEEADAYAELLHEQQAMIYRDQNALYNLLNDTDRGIIDTEESMGWQRTDDVMEGMLRDEEEQIARDLNNPALPEHDRKELEARKQEIQEGLKQYYGATDSAEVLAYREAQAEGVDLPFTEQYTQKQKEAAEDWQAAAYGKYEGTDPELSKYNQDYIDAREELLRLQNIAAREEQLRLQYITIIQDGYNAETGETLTDAQMEEIYQRMDELQTKMEAMEAEAKANISAANDSVSAVQEAKYGKKSFGRFVGSSVLTGFREFSDKLFKSIDFVFGKPMTEVGRLFDKNWKSPLTELAETWSRVYATPALQEAQMSSKAMGGEGWGIAQQTISGMVENIPNTLMAILSGGSSAASGLAGAQTAAVDAMADVGKNAVAKVAENLLTDYNYWTSFMQEVGSDYDEAVEAMTQNGESVNPLVASIYAMVSSFINAGIEIGTDGASGIQGISKGTDTGIVGQVVQAVAGHDMPLLESIIDSATDEATEELKQGIVGGLAMKALVDHDMQWISTDGSKAVINAQETGQSMLIGGLTGGLLAGVSEPLGRRSQQQAQNLEIGNRIIENQWGQQLGEVASEAGITDETADALKGGTLNTGKKKNIRKVGQLYNTLAGIAEGKVGQDYNKMREISEAASDMLRVNRGQIATNTQKEAIETGKKLAGTMQVSEDGKLRVIRTEDGKKTKTETEVTTGTTVPGSEKQESEAAPAAPQGKQTEPAEKPTKPQEKQTEPAEKPTEPAEKPTEPAEKPTEPAEKPTEPAEKPTEPAEKPTETAEEQTETEEEPTNTETEQAKGEAPETELVGVTVKDNKPYVKVRQNGKIEDVAFEDVQFPDEATAERAAISAMVGNEELSNAMFNSKAPGGNISFAEYARQFADTYEAAKNGLSEGAIKAAGLANGLQDVELHAAYLLGSNRQFLDDTMNDMRRQARAYIAGRLRGKVEDGDAYAVSDAMLKQEAGEELTEQETALLDKYQSEVQNAFQDMQEDEVFNAEPEEEPAIGTNTAYQYGLSGRRLEELERTLQEQGAEMTDEIRAEYERGAADLAYQETQRMEQVKTLNKGADGTRVGVLRSISAQEASDFGVNQISGSYTDKARSAITAMRGLAEATGVNIVLFESPVKEGVHQGANGWYDRNTQTVYLDVFSGQENEQAIMRTAAHELTHFIKDWSPALYKKYREFLLDYYYGTDKDTVKKLIQEQFDKDPTLSTEAEAMDEVIADASEMMISGDEDATRALAEKQPRLFVRIRGWIDTWAKAIHRAWHAISGTSNEASRLLQNSAEKFSEAQRMWWGMLEDASINLRGEIRQAEIEVDLQEKLRNSREVRARWKEEYEKRRKTAIERANAAETSAEAQQAVAEAKAAEAAEKALEKQQKQETAEINREAEEKKKDAEKITRKGKQIERKLNRLSEEAQKYVRQWAEEHGVALDGTMQTGSALSKMAAHYYNQGKAGIAFTSNTDDITDENREFAQHMNELGRQIYEEEALQAVAEENAQPEQEQPAEETETGEQPAEEAETVEQPAEEEQTDTEMEAALQAVAEEQTEAAAEETEEKSTGRRQVPENVIEEVVRNGFDDMRIYNMDAINSLTGDEIDELMGLLSPRQETAQNTEEETEQAAAPEETVDIAEPEQETPEIGRATIGGEETGLTTDQAIATFLPTQEETQAAEQHAETAEKMEDVLKDLPKKARGLVMKWASNEWVNISLEDGSPAAISFAKFAAKWYNAGKEGTSVIHVPWADTDADYPAFLQDTFYKAGRADAEAAEKRKKAREGKKNEKPADKGTGEGTGQPGLGAERVLAEVPAEDVQGESGGRDAVSEPEGAERLDGGNDAGSDESGTVRERGEGVRERDHVRSAAGVTEETAQAQEETEQTPEEQLSETVEETEEQLEAETPRGTNYSIGETLDLPNGEKARYKANVAAIRLLKTLEAEGRYATKEEQAILSKYVGWGGLAQAFDANNSKWTKEYAELAEVLTKEEYDAARASTVNAHYTSIEVIRAMYDGLRQMGFQGGRMLEPSGGIGHFIGAMPADLQQKVRGWTMVELDSITGRIAEKLYPNADVRVEGFENAKIGDNIMDVAIGNVPFGNFPIVDKNYPREVTGAIHNYFFAKAIDKVRPGGLLMFITSHYTMDANSSSVRDYMMKRADLLGAVRLPNTAFKGNAGTEVVTDILVFKKREPGTPYRGQHMLRADYTDLPGGYSFVNEYFIEHPDMVLGETAMTGTMYRGGELTVNPRPGNLGDQIREALGKIEGGMDYTSTPTVEVLRARAEKARKNTKENGFEVKDGKLYQNVNGELQAVEMKEADAQKVRGMLSIRDTARELQEMQKRGASEKEIKETRKKLNLQYDEFVKHNGLLHDRRNTKLIESDPDHFFIMALEDYDKKTKTATKAAIFERNTIAKEVTVTHADTPQDALAVVLNEKGYIDLARAAELLGMSAEDTQAAMINTGLAFLKPDGTLDTRENYLSGNVRAKLREAEALATVDDRYQRNVDELKKVIPEDIGRESIYVKPGATWIPDVVYEQFILETLKEWNGYRRNVTVKYIPSSGDYTLELSTQAKRDYRNTQEWGTPDKTFAEILEALMNNKQISVYRKTMDGKSTLDEAATLAAREKGEKIQKWFQEWLWQNEERAKQLETLYNDKYNAIVTPDYDGSRLTIAGANADKQLRPHQKNVVHRIVQGGGNTLIAHCVGAGKTAEMAGAAMKLRQLGIVQKPVFVVPKSLVGQWGREFLDFFPAAKILVLSENDFNAKNRKEFANRIATGDYDAVIMSREQYSHIPMTPEYEQQFYADTIAQITAAIDEEKRASGRQGLSVKNMEKTKKRLEAKLKKLETKARDEDNIYFEDMGIDSIFVDEAHEYKNLMFTTNMNNVSGLGNKEGSQRAFDMYMKTRYLRKLNGGRGIVFATATPVMNSMSEMYIMQKYLQEDTLNQLGIQSFDAWANLFGEVMTVIEPTPSGKGFRQKQAFARFKNLPELQRLFRSFADVKTKVEGLKIPKMKTGKRITIECEPGQFQLDYIDKLAERAEKMKNGHVDPKVDNMLKITSEGRKLSYTQRMIDPSLPYEDGSKIVRCVEEVEKIWKESKKNKGTQLIFCDMATPKGSSTVAETDSQTDTAEDTENVDFYGDIKRMLVAKGIPANEIAFIHDADTNEKKTKLFDDVNEGKVRVLIGSTGKMGVGMNAQKRIVALHHLDAPWRPGDIEQREGRALRQGNINEEVGIYVYVTKKTFDTRMWDNLYRKSSFINQIMNGTNTNREVEGDGDFALSAAEIKAIATGDPMIVEQFEVANKIKQIESLEREHNREKKLARYDLQANEISIARYRESLPLVESDQKAAAEIQEKDFRMKVEGKTYDARAKAAGPLLDAINKRQGIPGNEKIAEFGSFSILVNGRGEITIKGAGQYAVNANLESADGNITRVLNKIKNLQENLDNMRAGIRKLEDANKSLQAKIDAPFERAAELEELRARAEEIANILNPVEDQAGAAELEGSAEEKTVKFSMRDSKGKPIEITKQEMEENIEKVAAMPEITIETTSEEQNRLLTGDFISTGMELFSRQGGMAYNKILGEVRLSQSGLRHIVHKKALAARKARALPAVKQTIENGEIVHIENNHNGKPIDTAMLAAKVIMPDGNYFVGVTVSQHNGGTRGQENIYSFHDALAIKEGTADGGSQTEITDKGSMGDNASVTLTSGSSVTLYSILQEISNVKAKMGQSPRQSVDVQAKDGGMPGNYPTNQRLIQDELEVNQDGRVKSERDPNTLSNRQLLARAYEGVAKTDYERKSLERYKGIIAQLDSDTEKLRDLRRQIHDKKFVKGQVDRPGALKLQEQADELEKKIAKADKTLLYMERSASLKNVLEVEKREAEKKLRAKIKGQMQRYNEGVAKREYEERIKKTTERLAKWIVQPNKTNHVPKALRSSVAKFLLSIQQGQRTEFKGKGGKRRESNFLQNMRELQDIVRDINAYQMMGADERVQADFGMYIDLPDGFTDQMADLIRQVEDTMSKVGNGNGFAVDYMTAEQLKTLNQVLNTISASITQANDMLAINSFQHVSQAARNSIEYIRDQGRVENMMGGQVHNFLNWENMQPIRAFARFGEGGEAVFKSLMRGQAQMARNVREVIDMTEKVYTAEEARAWSEEIKTFDVGGKMISMPVADAMSMYCLMKRAQAVGHIMGEGFRVADFKQGRKTIAGSGATVTAEEAAKIIDSLTPRQKAVADQLQKIMSTVGSRWGNYVSMKRFGYEMFTEKNYFPIEVDSDRLMAKTDESKGNELYRLLNLSSVKPITRGANNRLMLKNIFDVYASHMSDMAQYNAMGLPVLDAVKWVNYRESMEKEDGTIETEGVRSAAREIYGNKSQRYIIELLKDINGTQATGDMGEQYGKKMLMRFNRQAVAANLSVAAKQPTSIIRAAMELGSFDLIRGAMGSQGKFNQNKAEMLEYSGIAIWKDLGFYDVNVSRPVKQMIMHADTAVDRLLEKATWMPEKADEITWAAMWGACKEWVRRQGKTYATTDEFMQAVADKFEDVIYKTQVVDSILTRSQFMRGTSMMNKMLSSFMSEPTTTYNILLDAWNKFRNDMRRGDSAGQAFMKNRSIITRTTAVYFTSAAVMTILNALIGAMRDDDDYETFMEKFQSGLLDNAIDEVLPFNLLPIVSDFYDYAKKFLGEYVLPDEWGISSYAGGSSAIYSAMDNALKALEIGQKYFSGESNYTLYGVTYKTANALGQFAGIPVAPAMRDVVSIWNTFVAPFAPEMRIESYESTEAMGAEALYRAIAAGDKGREALVRRQLAANNADEKKVNTALRSVIKAEKESGRITDKEAEKYLKDIAGMEANEAYFKVQEWEYEAGSEDDYSRYTRLEEALLSDSGVQAAVKELTQHGLTEKQVQTKIRSIISEQAVKNGMQPTKVASLLQKYGGMTADEAWIRNQELNYQKLTGTSTTSDIAMINYAVEKHTSPKEAIDGLLAHGKEKKSIASSITDKYKEKYLELLKTNVSQAATLKGQLISMFDYLGYDGKKKVEGWEKKK